MTYRGIRSSFCSSQLNCLLFIVVNRKNSFIIGLSRRYMNHRKIPYILTTVPRIIYILISNFYQSQKIIYELQLFVSNYLNICSNTKTLDLYIFKTDLTDKIQYYTRLRPSRLVGNPHITS